MVSCNTFHVRPNLPIPQKFRSKCITRIRTSSWKIKHPFELTHCTGVDRATLYREWGPHIGFAAFSTVAIILLIIIINVWLLRSNDICLLKYQEPCSILLLVHLAGGCVRRIGTFDIVDWMHCSLHLKQILSINCYRSKGASVLEYSSSWVAQSNGYLLVCVPVWRARAHKHTAANRHMERWRRARWLVYQPRI